MKYQKSSQFSLNFVLLYFERFLKFFPQHSKTFFETIISFSGSDSKLSSILLFNDYFIFIMKSIIKQEIALIN
jgi:hypothetical protein